MAHPDRIQLVVCFLLVSAATTPVGADERFEFFEKRIRPVLAEHCYECHSRSSGKQQGGLLLDSRSAIRRGGESGSAVVPHDGSESLLLQAIRYESFEMPPAGPLPAPIIADFARWIEMGAADPRDEDPAPPNGGRASAAAADELWSLQRLDAPQLPAVHDRSWPRDPLDYFVLARLEQSGLQPAPPATPDRLCRRLFLTLTGLPPTLEQIDSYLAAVDSAGERAAASQLVDQLLASARFGGRWGRHWLDLARYSDTNIGSSQRPWTNAWLYRNYVIQRFNEGLPLDRFVAEQLAGDMLPAESEQQRSDQLIATGFLALATRDLTERDAFQIQLDGIDDALDTIGKGLLGLSVGCARCHDHKFDPIPTRDYYALAGILKSSWLTGIRQRTATFNGDKLIKHSPSTPRSKLPGGLRATTVAELPESERSRSFGDMAIHVAGSYRRLGEVVPRGFLSALAVSDVGPIPPDESGRLQLAEWLTSDQNPLTPRVLANRVWLWTVGQPLVESVDNFGSTGRPPTHPALLDWLAVRLRDHHDWQIKPLIREIVLSRTWQMSTAARVDAMALDPGNRLYWRMNRRRLEAEQIHDSMLALSGELDERLIEQTLPEYEQENTTNTSSVQIEPGILRHRAVFFPIFRKDMPTDLDVLKLFNLPDPKFLRGRRETNTLPAQALFLWNGPLVQRAAERLAEQLTADSVLSDSQRAERLVRLLYVRAADAETVAHLIQMKDEFRQVYDKMNQLDAERKAWKRVIHTMLLSNEFVFVG